MNLVIKLCGGGSDWDEQEVPKQSDGDNCDAEEDKESTSGADKPREEDEINCIVC